MAKKMKIKADEKLNPKLKEEIQTLRGGIAEQAETIELPARFTREIVDGGSFGMIQITDLQTGRTAKIPLYGYGPVKQALNDLFGEEKK